MNTIVQIYNCNLSFMRDTRYPNEMITIQVQINSILSSFFMSNDNTSFCKIAGVSTGMRTRRCVFQVRRFDDSCFRLSENVSSRRRIVTAAALVAPTKARKTISIRSVPDAREWRIVWTLLSLLHPSVFPVTCRQVIERICLVTQKIPLKIDTWPRALISLFINYYIFQRILNRF